jgi:hypothetical protein
VSGKLKNKLKASLKNCKKENKCTKNHIDFFVLNSKTRKRKFDTFTLL